jgi:undecaprenyl-diphosphatase
MDHGLPEGVADKLPPVRKYELRTVLYGLAVALVGIPFGLLLQQVTSHGRLTEWDSWVAVHLHEAVRGHELLVSVLEVVSFTGKPIFLVFAIGLPGAWILYRGGRKLALFLLVTCVGGGIIDTLVKVAVSRPRPDLDEPLSTAFGSSFPSGHSMQAVVCYGALLLVLLPLLTARQQLAAKVAVVAWCLLIGASRLALGVHFVTDVLGGYVLGGAWLAASVAAWEIWREERGRRSTAPLEEGVEPEEDRNLASSGA